MWPGGQCLDGKVVKKVTRYSENEIPSKSLENILENADVDLAVAG